MPIPNLAELLEKRHLPGMTPEESAIARAWLEAHAAEFDSAEFNVRLGQGIEPQPDWDESTRRFAAASTTKRADVIARRGVDVTIVEVKVRAGLSALGQVLGYRDLWLTQNPGTAVTALVVAASAAEPDVQSVLQQQGVRLEIFPLVTA
jgi:hypothetical protein